jgi:glycine/D-amino acid oxidase-like deaminating enzyme
VVGAGNAALCAALSAREHGASVVVLECAPEAVTSLSSGQLLHRHGWSIVLATAVVMLAVALAATLWRQPVPRGAARQPLNA